VAHELDGAAQVSGDFVWRVRVSAEGRWHAGLLARPQ
jgi:hypothetical protein